MELWQSGVEGLCVEIFIARGGRQAPLSVDAEVLVCLRVVECMPFWRLVKCSSHCMNCQLLQLRILLVHSVVELFLIGW